jgi:hypothetical protein
MHNPASKSNTPDKLGVSGPDNPTTTLRVAAWLVTLSLLQMSETAAVKATVENNYCPRGEYGIQFCKSYSLTSLNSKEQEHPSMVFLQPVHAPQTNQHFFAIKRLSHSTTLAGRTQTAS